MWKNFSIFQFDLTRLQERYDEQDDSEWTQLCHLVRDNGFYCRRHSKNIERITR